MPEVRRGVGVGTGIAVGPLVRMGRPPELPGGSDTPVADRGAEVARAFAALATVSADLAARSADGRPGGRRLIPAPRLALPPDGGMTCVRGVLAARSRPEAGTRVQKWLLSNQFCTWISGPGASPGDGANTRCRTMGAERHWTPGSSGGSSGRQEEAMSRHSVADADQGARFDVRSADGTTLAVWVEGEGPPLVMVHGALSDHTRFAPLVDELRDGVTTFSMDRRGRGGSGDAPDYAIEREFEDVAAVVDAAATRAGGPVALWGHSYGANCALGGAALAPDDVHRLVLYEPGLGFRYPAGAIDAAEEALAAGDREAAVVALMVGVMGATDDEVEAMRTSPLWPTRLATVPTLPRELRAEERWTYRPGLFDAVTAPTMLLAGSESPPAQVEATGQAAAAIPDAEILVLEGHGHFAIQSDPAMVAAVLRAFIAPRPPS